jgi:hypothetical protein
MEFLNPLYFEESISLTHLEGLGTTLKSKLSNLKRLLGVKNAENWLTRTSIKGIGESFDF